MEKNLRFADDVALFSETHTHTPKTKKKKKKKMEKTLKQSELRKPESWIKNTPKKDKVHDKPCRQ